MVIAPSLQEEKQLAAKGYEDFRTSFLWGLFPDVSEETQVMKLNVENLPSCFSLILSPRYKNLHFLALNLLLPDKYCDRVKCRMASRSAEGAVQAGPRKGPIGCGTWGSPTRRGKESAAWRGRLRHLRRQD